tara:strand:- start:786 stop:974 length:189 start_codon:yes stop_codon:yes gene_type:complete
MYLLAIFIPLFGSLIAGFGGRYLGKYSGYIATFCLFISCLLSYFIFYEVALSGTVCYFQWKP